MPRADRRSLMEYADEVPINLANSALSDNTELEWSQSDLSCRYAIFAQAIGGSAVLFAASCTSCRTACTACVNHKSDTVSRKR